eukprot:30321_1
MTSKNYYCSVRRFVLCSGCGCVLLLIVVYLILFHAYHIGCILFAADNNGIRARHVCEPWINAIYSFIEIPKPMSSNQELHANRQEIMNTFVCSNYPQIIAVDGMHDLNIEFVILLSQRRGGSNFALSSLSQHPQITTGHEVTMRWFHFHCTQFVFDKDSKCKSLAMLSILNQWFVDQLSAYTADHTHPSDQKQIFLVKLQIEQLWSAHYRDFVHYISCNNITVIHYIRSAIIASYLSHSVDSIERIQTGNILKILSRPRKDKKAKKRKHLDSALVIDVSSAKEYVIGLETLHHQMQLLIQQCNIKYQRFLYENFIDRRHQNYYWNALQSFLGIDTFINGSMSTQTWMVREHQKPCFKRIANWNQIKHALNGSNSVYACQMINT